MYNKLTRNLGLQVSPAEHRDAAAKVLQPPLPVPGG